MPNLGVRAHPDPFLHIGCWWGNRPEPNSGSLAWRDGKPMCGITGWIDWKRDLRNQGAILETMNQTHCRRGPDAEGKWLSQHAALGHRRLAVIDLEGGPSRWSVGPRNEHTSLSTMANCTIWTNCGGSWNNAATVWNRDPTPSWYCGRTCNGDRHA